MLVKQSPVIARVHGTPLLVAVGPDGKSLRVFISRIDGKDAEFFLKGETEAETTTNPNADKPVETRAPAPETKPDASSGNKTVSPATPPAAKPWILLDTTTASEWNFQGCAISGPVQGK